MEQCETVARQLKKVRFTRFEARLAYERVWWPKISYPLAVTDFSKKQSSKLQKKFDNCFLGAMGINRRMPKAVIHGPKKLGGLQHKHIRTEQGCLHVSLLLYHLRHPEDEPCQLLSRVNLSHMAIESGLSQSVFSTEVPINRLVQYLLPSFMKTTWEYLHKHNASILSPSIPKLQIQLQHDQFLMSIFCESSSPAIDLRKLQMPSFPTSPSTQRHCNRGRLSRQRMHSTRSTSASLPNNIYFPKSETTAEKRFQPFLADACCREHHLWRRNICCSTGRLDTQRFKMETILQSTREYLVRARQRFPNRYQPTSTPTAYHNDKHKNVLERVSASWAHSNRLRTNICNSVWTYHPRATKRLDTPPINQHRNIQQWYQTKTHYPFWILSKKHRNYTS